MSTSRRRQGGLGRSPTVAARLGRSELHLTHLHLLILPLQYHRVPLDRLARRAGEARHDDVDVRLAAEQGWVVAEVVHQHGVRAARRVGDQVALRPLPLRLVSRHLAAALRAVLLVEALLPIGLITHRSMSVLFVFHEIVTRWSAGALLTACLRTASCIMRTYSARATRPNSAVRGGGRAVCSSDRSGIGGAPGMRRRMSLTASGTRCFSERFRLRAPGDETAGGDEGPGRWAWCSRHFRGGGRAV